MTPTPIASRRLNPIVWVVIAVAVVIDLVFLPLTEPFRQLSGDGVVSIVTWTSTYLTDVGMYLLVIGLAFTFGWSSLRSLPGSWKLALKAFIAVWVAVSLVSFVVSVADVWASDPIRTVFGFWLVFFFPNLVSNLVSARLLWLVPPERRGFNRPVSGVDRTLAVALALSVAAAFYGAYDQNANIGTVDSFFWLFLAASLLPLVISGGLLWLMASPHPQGMRGRDTALAVGAGVVISVIGVVGWISVENGSFDVTLQLVPLLMVFIQVYLAYWAWEHVENEPVDFPEDHYDDWADAPVPYEPANYDLFASSPPPGD